MKNTPNLRTIGTEYADQISILVVEGNVNEQLMLHYLLRQQIKGALPIGATSGQQALAYLKNCYARQHTLPSFILLDLYLPQRIDGWKLLRKIRSHPIYHSIPVVIVSSLMDSNDIEQSYHWGVNSYLPKPIVLENWQEILPILPRLMQRC